MKNQSPSAKISKKTVFVYKNVKSQNSFSTNPTGDMSHSVMTSFIIDSF
ncbi:hypothetical protein [Pedobacter sandarakinus]|nr:hypothetical protein [Pedobacter sandarakinus]MCX2573267.1 hypothetical protein [Pedobacter sandarakinus]